MRKIIFISAFFCATIAAIYSQGAAEFNAAGFSKYQKNDYRAAAVDFEKAVKADTGFKIAYYNLSCVYSLMIADVWKYYSDTVSNPCVAIMIRQELVKKSLDSLKSAVKLDEAYKGKSLNDPDLIFLRGYREYYEFLETDFSDEKDLYVYVKGISRFGVPGLGIYDPAVTLKFLPNAKVEFFSGWVAQPSEYHKMTADWYLYKQDGRIFIRIDFDAAYVGWHDVLLEILENGDLKTINFQLMHMDHKYLKNHDFIPNYENCGA